MSSPLLHHRWSSALWLAIACSTSFLLWGWCGGGDDNSGSSEDSSLAVAKAKCGANDSPETGLQGQVPAALRVLGGFKGFSCNLQLVGQSRNDGASWQHAHF